MKRMSDIKTIGSNSEEFSLDTLDRSAGTSGREIPKNTAVFKQRTNQSTVKGFKRG
jgi:hypothetical protein